MALALSILESGGQFPPAPQSHTQQTFSGASERQTAVAIHLALDPDLESDYSTEATVIVPDEATPARKEEPVPPPILASSSPDDMVVGPSNPVPQDDFRAHQEPLKRVALNLGLEMEELKEPVDALFDILVVYLQPASFSGEVRFQYMGLYGQI